jgi:hypothetical protein
MTEACGDVVSGRPRIWLRLEGLALLVAALVLFGSTHQPWWLVPVVILLPDLSMLGYLGNTRLGAMVYNAGHSIVVPAVVAVVALRADSPLGVAFGLLWFAHIGMDRLAGYGLKYDDRFTHTHLGWIGPDRAGAADR